MGNSWSDIFYPGNPERRKKVVRLSSRLFTVMEDNFSATNDLTDLIKKHCTKSCKLQHVHVDPNATMRSNADTLIKCLKALQDYVDDIDKDLAKMLDPDLYKELKSPDLTIKDKIEKVNRIFTATLSTIGTVVGIALVAAISSGAILTGAVAAIGALGTSVVAGITLGVFLLGVDMIAGAIFGAVERDKLEHTISELEDILEEFEPASKKFQRSILYVVIKVEDYYND